MPEDERALSFADLIAPLDPVAFFADIWEKRVEVLARNDSKYYRGLITASDVDAAIGSMGLSFPDVRLVNVVGAPEVSTYTRPDGRIIPPAVMRLFADGATIVLNQLHRRLEKLGTLCRALEFELGLAFQTNIYLSPPNAGGFKVHYDTHDVFVLQLEGKKDWEFYESPFSLPMPGQHHDETPVTPGPSIKKIQVNAGDLIYVPRGIYHSAVAGDAPSLHVTLGALSKTWAELLIEAVAEVSQRDVEFRRALPVGLGTGRLNFASAKATFDHLLRRLADHADFDQIASAFAHEFVRSRDAGGRGQMADLAQLADVGLNTVVKVRENLMYLIDEQADRVAIQLAQRSIEFPLALSGGLASLLSGAAVRVGDIQGPLDDKGRLVLAVRLIKEGVLTTETV